MKPGGIHYYNTTGSQRAMITGCTSFPHALRIANFLAVSGSPMSVDRQRWRRILMSYSIDGKLVFDLSQAAHRQRLEEVLSMPEVQTDDVFAMESAESIRRRLWGVPVITDDNMGTEWLPARDR